LQLTYYGIVFGLIMLVSTGLGHIIVIKGEYHFGFKVLPVFLLVGVASVFVSLVTENNLISGSLGIFGVTFLWGIHEVIKQRERVEKGWFPKKIE
jgi:sulfite exporter TauE/SafE